jgi:hypothetical protein
VEGLFAPHFAKTATPEHPRDMTCAVSKCLPNAHVTGHNTAIAHVQERHP